MTRTDATTADLAQGAATPYAQGAAKAYTMSTPHAGAPRLLICDVARAGQGETASDPVGALAGGAWPHPRVGACYAQLPADASSAFDALADGLRRSGADGVLLVDDAADADAIEVEIFARNLAPRRHGQPSARITPTGPASARATAPAAELVRALADEGLRARISSGARAFGDRTGHGNYLLYRLLTEVAGAVGAPTVGLVRLPAAMRGDAASGLRGLRAAAIAFADTLSPVRARA